MNFELTKTEQLFRQMIREFAENEVKPLAAEIDEEERFPVETVEKMAKLGIFGIPFPVNYGGAGGNNILYSMAVEELSRVCATTGVVVSAHTSLCAAPIYEHGTEEQKMKYLPKLCSGEWLGAFGLTEPNAGTDAAAQQTTAVDAGDHYILNGNKIFITNAAYAHVYIVMEMALKKKEKGKPLGKPLRWYLEYRRNVLENEDHLFSMFKLNDRTQKVDRAMKKLPERYSVGKLDAVATKLGENATGNNPFDVSKKFWNKRLKGNYKKLKGKQADYDYTQSPEFADFQLVLQQFKDNNMDVMFIIPPVNRKDRKSVV